MTPEMFYTILKQYSTWERPTQSSTRRTGTLPLEHFGAIRHKLAVEYILVEKNIDFIKRFTPELERMGKSSEHYGPLADLIEEARGDYKASITKCAKMTARANSHVAIIQSATCRMDPEYTAVVRDTLAGVTSFCLLFEDELAKLIAQAPEPIV